MQAIQQPKFVTLTRNMVVYRRAFASIPQLCIDEPSDGHLDEIIGRMIAEGSDLN